MILIKLALISIALFYSTVSLADNISDKATMKIKCHKATMKIKCHEVTKLRCLEVQEYGQEFVGPQVDKAMKKIISAGDKKPTALELVCCERNTRLERKMVRYQSSNESFIGPMLPDHLK